MQTGDEIKAAVNNAKYYAQEIKKLARRQFELDWANNEAHHFVVEPCCIRFNMVAAIGDEAAHIEHTCNLILNRLEQAETQDKFLYQREVVGA